MNMIVSPYRYAAAGIDPYFSFVRGLWHFEGTNGGTGPYTNNGTGGSLTNTSNTSLSNTTVPFAGATTALRCNSGYCETAVTNTYNPNAGDFAVEFWLRMITVATKNIFGWGTGGVAAPVVYTLSDGSIYWYFNNANKIASAASVISANTWYYGAVARSGSSTKMFIGTSGTATQVGSTFSGTDNLSNGVSFTAGAAAGGSVPFDGYLRDLRISIGTDRGYVASAPTVPTAPFPDS